MKKRLLQIAEYLNISVRELERKIGLKRGNISNMSENSEIGSVKLAKIIDIFPEISSDWLLTGNGEMLRKSYDLEDKKSDLTSENVFFKDKYIAELEKNEQLRIEIDSLKTELFEIKKERVEQVSDAKTATILTGTYS